MRVSVVICTYDPDMYGDFVAAAESVLNQTYTDVELVIVIDGNDNLCDRARDELGDRSDTRIHCNQTNQGLAISRNRGVDVATGDVIAFLDDDAVADPDWVETLVEAYETHDRLAVGGRMIPSWVAGEPDFLPEEFYWLVGVTHRGFSAGPGEVRNTNGSNMSFKREVFEALGGFDPDFGRRGDRQLQAEETEFCARMADHFGEGMYYVPDATVAHKIFDWRTDPRWLLQRAFWQGYSKRVMERHLPEAIGAERTFLARLVGEFIPARLAGLARRPSKQALSQLLFLILLTGMVGAGYGYGLLTSR